MLSVQLGHREVIYVNGSKSDRSLKVLLRSPEPGALTLFYFGDWGKNSFP